MIAEIKEKTTKKHIATYHDVINIDNYFDSDKIMLKHEDMTVTELDNTVTVLILI